MNNPSQTKEPEWDELYPICKDCSHSMSMHIGEVPMGGGHSEVLGCTHMVDYEKKLLCDCLNYDEDMYD